MRWDSGSEIKGTSRLDTPSQFVKKQIRPLFTSGVEAIDFFQKKRSSPLYRKENDKAYQAISFETEYPEQNIAYIKIDGLVSIKIVTNKLLEIGYFEANDGDFLATMYSNSGYIKGTGYHRYEIDISDDIKAQKAAVDAILGDVRDFVVPFLENYSNAESIFDLAFRPDTPALAEFFTIDRQSLTTMILAEELGRPDKIPEIIAYTLTHCEKSKFFASARERFVNFTTKLGYGHYLLS